MKFKRKSSAGLTLIELMLAVGIIAVAMVGIIEYMDRESQRQRAELAGEQMALIGKAVEKMVVQEGSNFKACIPVNQVITVPIAALYTNGGPRNVGPCQITNRPHLAWSNAGNPVNAFGSNYVISVRNQGNGYVTGLVTLDAPVRSGPAIKYDWLGIAAKKIGANGGGTFVMTGANRMNGVGAGWSITTAEFPVVSQLGILGYKTSVGGDLDNVYLRLDGAYPMRGDLNAGNFSINNVTDLNVNGWINGNNALVNNLKTSYVAANHMQTNTLNATSHITTGNRNPNIRPTGWGGEFIKSWDILSDGGSIGIVRAAGGTDLAVRMDRSGLVEAGNFSFNDMNYAGQFTRDGRGRYVGYLKDRLPKYVLRGVEATMSGWGVGKPNCSAAQYSTGAGGRERIIVTPMYQNVYTEYDVTANLTPSNSLVLYRTLTGRDQLQTYAVHAGGMWVVYANSYMGQNLLGLGVGNGRVLVQTFCDFGD